LKLENLNIMTEQQVQSKRIKQLEAEGYYVIKLIRTNKNGIPDIVAIPPNSGVIFSEVKKPGGKPSELQKFRARELISHGINVELFDGEIKKFE
jgi:Holliday junction resolvase